MGKQTCGGSWPAAQSLGAAGCVSDFFLPDQTSLNMMVHNHPEVDKTWGIQGTYLGSFKDRTLSTSRTVSLQLR